MLDWWIILIGSFSLLIAVFMTGVPMFVAFLLVNIGGVLMLIGPRGFPLMVNSIFNATTVSSLTAIPLFILLGEILFRAGSVDLLLRAVDKLVGRLRGRQYAVSILLSAIFGALSGAAVGVAAMMARSLYGAMTGRGYDRSLTIGTILGGASLAPIIPPSLVVIIIATLADVSIAKLLIAGILPGLLLALAFFVYCMVRVWLNHGLAPPMEQETVQPLTTRRLIGAIADLLPFTIIIFSVMGFILLGIATPTEAAATGVVGALATALYFRKLNWHMLSESLGSAAMMTSMIIVIMASSNMFGQLLAFTGSARMLATTITGLEVAPEIVLFLMMAIVFVLCMFIDQTALLLILIPIYKPIVASLGFDPVWFWLLMLLNMTVGGITPPFGYTMFAFKGGAPSEVTLEHVYKAAWPIVGMFLMMMLLVAVVPSIATFLPSML